MSKTMSVSSVILSCISAVLLGVSIFFPWWGMNFIAPQYPEGLDIIVYPYKMDGRIDIINGLNHYIGMQEFSEETFPELTYLPYIVGAMACLILIVALVKRTKLMLMLVALFSVGGVLGLYDINRWLTTFGTNLNPKAPIQIDPFVPPILGENTLANFVTHSYFATGAFLMGASYLLLVYTLWRERKK